MKFWILPLALGLCCAPAHAWGAGHEDTQRELNQRLPAPLRAALSPDALELSMKDSHYPDSFKPFEPSRIGQAAFDKLEKLGIKRRYDLHSDKGRAITFVMLVEALRENQPEHALFWIASLGHSAADMVACNHDPLVHVATYSWVWKDWEMKLPNGEPFSLVGGALDLAPTARDTRGGQLFQQQIQSTLIADDGRDADQALLDIMLYGQEGAAYCAPRGVPILAHAAAYFNSRDDAEKVAYQRLMAELGAWAVVRVNRDVEVAQRLARGDAPVAVTPAVMKAYDQAVEKITRERPLSDDAMYQPILRPLKPNTAPAVGVVLEPTWRMNDGFIGFGERVLAASICRTLGESGRPYATVDVRDVLTRGLPSPQQMPVVVMAARVPRSYVWMKTDDLDKALQPYLDAGGKVVWIGGTQPPLDALKPLADAMQAGEEKGWPLPIEELLQSQVQLVGADAKASWSFVRSPQTPAGWQVPQSRYYFGDSDALKALVELRAGERALIVGAAWPRTDPRAVFLPTYALWPHLLTPDATIERVDEPRLDGAGAAILQQALDALTKPISGEQSV